MSRTPEQVFLHHWDALLNGDFPALLADYADDAVLLTMGGAFVGKADVRFSSFPISGEPSSPSQTRHGSRGYYRIIISPGRTT